MTFRVAIIGKPNVGKSTIFNRLCGRKLAITHDRPGVTRDAKSHPAKLGKFIFEAVDTAGLDFNKEQLVQQTRDKALEQAKIADVILFVIDGRKGINGDDLGFADIVRKLAKTTVLIINKCEGRLSLDYKAIYRLGFGEPLLISAEHNQGFLELEHKLKEIYKDFENSVELCNENLLEKTIPVRISLLGRPNAGKSTLFNKLLGFERSIVSEVSGTTRDAIGHELEFKERIFELIDTAGLRKKARVTDSVESLSVAESINALRRSHVVLMVIDATNPLEKQDFTILRLAIKEGRAIILIINKCDLIQDKKLYQKELEYFIKDHLYEIKGVSVLFISAKHDKGFNKIFDNIISAQEIWQTKLNTAQLNNWLKEATTLHIPPLSRNSRRIRFKYATQTAIRPPTFTIFGNIPEDLPDSYTRYLYNSLREAFNIYGCPIRIKYKKSDNPYNKF